MSLQTLLVSTLTLAGKKVVIELVQEVYTKMKDAKHPQAQSLLKNLDLESDLQIIESFVKEITVREEEEGEPDVVDVALNQVKDVLDAIKKELEKIHKEIEEHENRYFAAYRQPNFQINFDELVQNKVLLDKRVDILMKLVFLKDVHQISLNTILDEDMDDNDMD